MRLICVFFLLAACGDSQDPHALVACQGWVDNQGNPFTGMCETACKTKPQISGNTCDTVKELGCNAIDFEGTRGCCLQDGETIKFYECQ